jgi:hypothetical protein
MTKEEPRPAEDLTDEEVMRLLELLKETNADIPEEETDG